MPMAKHGGGCGHRGFRVEAAAAAAGVALAGSVNQQGVASYNINIRRVITIKKRKEIMFLL